MCVSPFIEIRFMRKSKLCSVNTSIRPELDDAILLKCVLCPGSPAVELSVKIVFPPWPAMTGGFILRKSLLPLSPCIHCCHCHRWGGRSHELMCYCFLSVRAAPLSASGKSYITLDLFPPFFAGAGDIYIENDCLSERQICTERERQRCCLIWLVKLECFESFAAIKLFGSEMCNHFSEQNSTACLFVFFIYIESFCTLHNNFKLSYESRLSCSKLLFPQRLFGGKMSYVFVLGRFHTCLIWAVIACHRNILYGIRYAVTNMQSLCLFLFPLGVSPKHADCSPT